MNYSMSPPQASNFSGWHDLLFYALLALTVVFTLIVGVAVVIFAAKYRVGSKANRARPVHEHLPLELTWSIIPLILGVIMFLFSAKLFIWERTPPKDALNIYVVGKQWMWHVQHENGVRENNTLHVPVGKPVKLTMISQDVLHAFYIPAFRIQYHVVPGRYTQTWFTATKAGTYHLWCAMYCGTQHSEMAGYVYAMEPKEYAEWLAKGGEDTPHLTMEQEGARLWNKLGCGNGSCHGSSDSERGPSLNGIMGKTRKFTDGTSLVADDAYLRESILQPYNHVTAGFENTMPAYQDQIEEEELMSLLAYIKTLGNTPPAKTASEPSKGAPLSGPYDKRVPSFSTGAIEAQRPGRPGATPGNNSVGAESVQKQGSKE
jgi:cytochrome c oxidase subunit II